jgi:hypothetical protein
MRYTVLLPGAGEAQRSVSTERVMSIMTMWDGKLMKENEFSKPAKLFVDASLTMLMGFAAVTAVQHAAQGMVKHPGCGLMALLGFLCFLFPKLAVMRHKQWLSFGTRLMTENQANCYRVGYLLMVLGVLFTFL